jgi:Ca2+-dependent lipid-binding protein
VQVHDHILIVGIHRGLGVHVSKLQSIVLDNKWDENALTAIKSVGNEKFNAIYEYELGNVTKPNSLTNTSELEQYIHDKYVNFKFASPDVKKSSDLHSKVSPVVKSKNDVGMIEYHGSLDIILHGAHKLPAKDLNGTSDPYFIFTIRKQKIQSKTIYKSLSPYYQNQNLKLCMNDQDSLTIECRDEDLLKSDFIGTATYDLGDLVKASGKGQFVRIKLFDKKKEVGTVDLTLRYDVFDH